MPLAEALNRRHANSAFRLLGLCPAQPSRRLAAFQAWISAELHGKMGYLARPDRQVRRADLNIIFAQCSIDHLRWPRLPHHAITSANRQRSQSWAYLKLRLGWSIITMS